MSTKKANCCFYKGDHAEYFVICDPDTVKRWRKDKTIPLTECVDRFEIYCYLGDVKGEPVSPDKGQLKNDFNASNTDEAIYKILEEGEFTTKNFEIAKVFKAT